MPNYSIPQSALNSLGVVMQVTANNIANVNTNGFHAGRVTLASGPYQDEGVRVGSIDRDFRPGPAVINDAGYRNTRAMDAMVQGHSGDGDDKAFVMVDADRLERARLAKDAWNIENYRERDGAMSRIRGMAEASNTDLAREFTTMIGTENAYSANAATIRAWDELTGAILNVKT